METILAVDAPRMPGMSRAGDSRRVEAGRAEAGQVEAGQGFVARLRGAAPLFAAAAGALTAVVREAVPPARHRRSRCRVVLRMPDGGEVDVTCVGPTFRPGAGGPADLAGDIGLWLAAGQPRDPAWMVADADAPDGIAVDIPAWVATA